METTKNTQNRPTPKFAVGDIVKPGMAVETGWPNGGAKVLAVEWNDAWEDWGYSVEPCKWPVREIYLTLVKSRPEPVFEVGDTVRVEDRFGTTKVTEVKWDNYLNVWVYRVESHTWAIRKEYLKLVAKAKPEPKFKVGDRVKFKWTKDAGSVLLSGDSQWVTVQWDGKDHPTAERQRDLILLHSPSAKVVVDEEALARVRAERERLLKIIQAVHKELAPVTEEYRRLKRGTVVG